MTLESADGGLRGAVIRAADKAFGLGVRRADPCGVTAESGGISGRRRGVLSVVEGGNGALCFAGEDFTPAVPDCLITFPGRRQWALLMGSRAPPEVPESLLSGQDLQRMVVHAFLSCSSQSAAEACG